MLRLRLVLLVLSSLLVGQVASDPQICQNKIQKLVLELLQFPKLPTDMDDLSVLMFTGKGVYDMGTKELCDLNPNMRFVMATPKQPAYIGVCIYKECSVDDLNSLRESFSTILPFPVEFYDHELKEEIEDQQRAGMIGTCVVIVLLAICGIAGIVVEYSTFFDRAHSGQNIPDEPTKRNDKEIVKSKNKLGLFFLSFSFTRNWRKLMSTAGGGEGYDENLDVFAGVRTFSMMYVILGHWFSFLVQSRSFQDFTQIAATWNGIFIQGGEYAVDAFFCMAAFLGTYVLLGKLSKSRSICFNFPLAYFHRWYRLIPTLAFVTLLIMYIFPYLPQGPVSPTFYFLNVPACNKYWWPNFLFINNFYPWELNSACIGQVWYLANDYQFFFITPFLLMLMRLHKQIAYSVNILLVLLSIMSSLVITYHYQIYAPNFSGNWSDDYYNKPYCRLAAYMVGVLLAQLYYDRKLAKNGDPNLQNSCGNVLFRMYERSSIVAWISVLIGMFLTTFLIFYFQTAYPSGSWNLTTSMIWNALSRPLFVLGMMMVLLPTYEGRLTWLKSFMSCGLFKVIGKFTYSAYLIHIAVISLYVSSSNNSEVQSRDGGYFSFFGVYTLSYAAAIIITLLVEFPTLNIEKTILFPPKPKSKPAQTQDVKQALISEQSSYNQSSEEEITVNGSNGHKNGYNGAHWAINGNGTSTSSQNGTNGFKTLKLEH